MNTKPDDVLIAGGGFAGLTLAIALRQGLGESFSVTVADPAFASSKSNDMRASAIAGAARRLFEAVGAWQAVAHDAQPILDMVITDSKLDDAVRPTFLTFGGEIEPGEPFAHMIENRHLIDALVARAREQGVALLSSPVTSFERNNSIIEIRTAGGEARRTANIVSADSATTGGSERPGMELIGRV
jgi:2-octaprenyl-6-methoxyphenol hydroxylase